MTTPIAKAAKIVQLKGPCSAQVQMRKMDCATAHRKDKWHAVDRFDRGDV